MKLVPEESPLLRLLLLCFFPLAVGLFILVRLAPDSVLTVAHCPLRDGTGLPCPTCGSTLAATQLAAGNWGRALQCNPLVVVSGVAYLISGTYAAITTMIPRWRRSLHLTPTGKKTARWLAILLVALNWTWLLPRYLS